MKIMKKQLDLKSGIEKEWLITNGIGGFASQTVLGINTRKYHGLLVAPLMPPARRYVILSKVDESILIDGKEESITVSKNGKPVIQLVPIAKKNSKRIGAAKKEMQNFNLDLDEFNSISIEDFEL